MDSDLVQLLAEIDEQIKFIEKQLGFQMPYRNPFVLKWNVSNTTTTVHVTNEDAELFKQMKLKLANELLQMVKRRRLVVLKELKKQLRGVK